MFEPYFNPFLNKSENLMIDVLTGCWNRLRFIDYLAELMTDPMIDNWSVIGLDLNYFKKVNDRFGHQIGDLYLQWVASILKKANPHCFRYGGDEFYLVFVENGHASHNQRARDIYEQLNRELRRFSKDTLGKEDLFDEFIPVATMAVVNFFKKDELDIDRTLSITDQAVYTVKLNRTALAETFRVFDPKEFTNIPSRGEKNWVTQHLLQRISDLNRALIASNTMALSDQVSGLPNALAAENFINNYLAKSNPQKDKLCLLFIDGDDLRQYNQISYHAGDVMIRDLAGIISRAMHGGGFLARWRRGDEFVLILPDVPMEGAKDCAERIRANVEENTRAWQIPITVSIGLACYPENGENLDDLLEHAEKGLTYAKQHGKNQISLAA